MLESENLFCLSWSEGPIIYGRTSFLTPSVILDFAGSGMFQEVRHSRWWAIAPGAAEPGWDKIFCFVGTNIFRQKFRPKQRESDATEDVQIALIWVLNMGFTNLYFYLWQETSFCHKKFLPMPRHFFLWQEISFHYKKFLLSPRNFFLWLDIFTSEKKLLPVTRNFFLWQDISALDLEYRFLSVTRNFSLWQLITCRVKMFLPLTRKYFLHIVCDRKNSFIWQEIWKYLEVKFAPKQREFLPKFHVSLKISWEPGSLVPG